MEFLFCSVYFPVLKNVDILFFFIMEEKVTKNYSKMLHQIVLQ